ncbi:TonB-dependent receptor plug domain-containing protein [Tahibacter amnicola]|uniref:TonB-dependent receptor n=1 Tax=Tahibacter amnicola TaxID=2976241 RepID=A0ABY6BIJ7_9GAMM|nr:TonB-dependent receptor [Tahibacter amnicola]UXI69689.1 TonB-dependent receptor [Tahibacter amnicola]
MKNDAKRTVLAVALALAIGQSRAAPEQAGPDVATSMDEIVVQADITYRDRSDETPPVLVYDLEYFQRFEPLTVGDMLKRVPSVAFVSDVLEYDGAQLRGLQAAYTQVLINGKKVPGAGDDRSFFVDRIPAELVDHIEVVRSASASRSGDAVAGALNIVLREAYAFDGAYLRAGALHFDDGTMKPTYGGLAGGDVGGGRLLAGFNVQGRYNPKQKQSVRFEEPGGDFVDREDQDDIRDGTDYSANLSYHREFGPGELDLSAFLVRTDRRESEHSVEFNDPVSRAIAHRVSVNDQVVDIDQDNYSLAASYRFEGLGGATEISLQRAAFDDSRFDTEEESSFDDEEMPPAFDEREGTRTLTATHDTETTLRVSHQRAIGGRQLAFGIDLQRKDRDTTLLTAEVDTDEEHAPLPPYTEFVHVASDIQERRVDPWITWSGQGRALRWETGLRYERTDADIHSDNEAVANEYRILLPSAHFRWELSDGDRLRLSLARTVRRPDFKQLLPVTLEEEFGDNDFIGNPSLKLENAWGLDLGFEHRLGKRGVVGINLFYRNVRDLIEVVNTGTPSATALDDYEEAVDEFLEEHPGATAATPGYPVFDPDSFVFSAANVGHGRVYGVELDVSTPLTALGLPDTGVFANYSWLDSSVRDAMGARRFNNQPRFVYNVGVIHDIPSVGMSVGASYRKQGDAEQRLLAEEVRTEYGADLEAFVEKRFGDSVSVRLTASNLLNARKDEFFGKFDTLGDQQGRDFDEYELESEQSGPVVQLIARFAF